MINYIAIKKEKLFKVIFIVNTTILASCDLPNSSDAENKIQNENEDSKNSCCLMGKTKEAKEIINLKEKKVVVNVAPNPLSDVNGRISHYLLEKNINRNLLFTKSAFIDHHPHLETVKKNVIQREIQETHLDGFSYH